MTRTHIELDESVLNQIMQLGQYNSKKQAINTAMSVLANQLKRQQLLGLEGSIPWSGDLTAIRTTRLEQAAAQIESQPT